MPVKTAPLASQPNKRPSDIDNNDSLIGSANASVVTANEDVSGTNSINGTDGHAFIDMTKDVLHHLYCPSRIYHARSLATFYHPTLASYADPFVAFPAGPETRSKLRRLLALYYTLFVREMTFDIAHISSRIGGVVVGGQLEQGISVMTEFSLRIIQYTLLGRVLALVGILPPVTFLAGSFFKHGVRIISKLTWIPDTNASPFEQRGLIVQHEDMYADSARVMATLFFYPTIWCLLVLRLAASAFLAVVNATDFMLSLTVAILFRFGLWKSKYVSPSLIRFLKRESPDLLVKHALGYVLDAVLVLHERIFGSNSSSNNSLPSGAGPDGVRRPVLKQRRD